jgi:hypothetical protein
MPVVLRINGFRFIIRTADHLPPHVHVFRAGTEVEINIGLNGELPTIRAIVTMSNRDMKRALEIAAENNDLLLRRWHEIHG